MSDANGAEEPMLESMGGRFMRDIFVKMISLILVMSTIAKAMAGQQPALLLQMRHGLHVAKRVHRRWAFKHCR